MSPEEFQQRLKSLEKEFKDFVSYTAPKIAGTVAVRLFKQNFQNQGFFGEAWQEVQRRQPWTRTHKSVAKRHPADTKRKILTGRTGDLGRSITCKVVGDGTAIIFTDPNAFSSKEPYGRVHNEGLPAGRGSGFTMPKRQFIGDHPTLRQAIMEELEQKANEIINKS
jgi:phage gpG-like protein